MDPTSTGEVSDSNQARDNSFSIRIDILFILSSYLKIRFHRSSGFLFFRLMTGTDHWWDNDNWFDSLENELSKDA